MTLRPHDCPDENALVAMIEHALPPARLRELEDHFGGCDRCCRIVAALAGSRASLAVGTPRVLAPHELFASVEEPGAPALAGTVAGRYEVLEPLGRGGMGSVYLARDLTLDRDVALKIHRAGSGDERLEREAIAMAKLAHPNVVAVYEIGNVGDRLFVAMEYIRGPTLRGWLAERRRTTDEIVRLLAGAGAGLAAAHAAGLVHRDFKPENVLVGDDGRPRVSDFGLVRLADARTRNPPVRERDVDAATAPTHDASAGDAVPVHALASSVALRPADAGVVESGPTSGSAAVRTAKTITIDGSVIGTPAYMSPEQFAGGVAIDARSDQFAFCVAAWECVFGVRPFAGATLAAIQLAIEERAFQDRTSPRAAASRQKKIVPARGAVARIRRVLERGLAVNPDDRFVDMPALLAALARAAAPRTGKRLAVAAAAVVVAVGIAIPVATRIGTYRHDEECSARADEVRRAFGADTRMKLAGGLVGTGSPFADAAYARTSSVLERHAEALAERTAAVCRAPDLPETSARRACLAERTRELTELVDMLTHADTELVLRAPSAAWSLYEADPCRDPQLRGLGITRAPEHASMLARASALVEVGRYDEAVPVATRLADDARRRDDRATELAALLVLGHAHETREDAEAVPVLHRALALAESLGRDGDAATALDGLAGVAGLAQHDYAAAHRHVELAHAKLERAGNKNPIATGRLLATEAQILMDELRLAEAEPVVRRAVATLEEAFGPDHPVLGSTLGIESQILHGLGKLDESLVAARRARDILERALGPHHPTVAGARMTIAAASIDARRYGEARDELHAADAVFARVFGDDHPVRAAVAGNLGGLEQAVGNASAAVAAYGRAVAILERSEGPTSPATSGARRDLARALAQAGRFDEALAENARAIAIARALGDAGRSRLRGALVERADVLLSLSRRAEALAAADRALALAAAVPDQVTPEELAETRAIHARASAP